MRNKKQVCDPKRKKKDGVDRQGISHVLRRRLKKEKKKMEKTEKKEIYYAAIPFNNPETAKKVLNQIYEKLDFGGCIIKETQHYITKKTYQNSEYEHI